MSVYVRPRSEKQRRLHIIDIPTTLLTSAEVITRIDNFWGAGDRNFKSALARREIAAFGRRLRALIKEKQLSATCVEVVMLTDVEKALR